MRLEIYETTLKRLDSDRNILDTSVTETYVIYPDAGKKLVNKNTGFSSTSFVGINAMSQIKDYEEVEDDK